MVWATTLILAAGAASFDLDCKGGTVVDAATSTTTAVVAGRSGYATGSAVTTEPTLISFDVRITINGDTGQVQGPAGSTDKLKKIAVSDDSITAEYGGLLNKRKFFIDRRSGKITTSAGFNGICKPREDAPRAF